jgi:hypothetical protein
VIPDRVAEHLQGPSFIQVATRNADLRPGHAHVVGAVVHDDRETVTFFVHETRAKRIVDDLEQNGRVALEAAQASHEAYQLKGRYVSSRPSSEEEYAVQESYKKRIVEGLMQFFPEELAKPIAGVESEYRPSIAITFRVEEVFLQTPGPGAGTKMET